MVFPVLGCSSPFFPELVSLSLFVATYPNNHPSASRGWRMQETELLL